MKKAKFALSVVAVVGVVGGALAFKASRDLSLPIYTQKVVGNTTYCTEPVITLATTNPVLGTPFFTNASIQPTTAPCPRIQLYANE